jgi:chromosome segregation ATPase
LQIRVKNLENESQLRKQQAQELGNSLRARDEDISRAKEKQAQLITQLTDYQNRLARLQQDKASLQAQVNDLKSQQEVTEARYSQLTQDLKQKETTIEELRDSQQGLLKKHAASLWQIKEYKARLTSLESDNLNLQAKLKALQDKEAFWQKQNQEFSGIIRRKDAELEELRNKQQELIQKAAG